MTNTVKTVVKNTLTPMGISVVNKVIDFFFAIFVIRTLGPTAFGKYSFVIVVWWYLSILSDFGLGTLLTREVARNHALINRYISNTISLRILLSLLAFIPAGIVILIYGLFFGTGGDTSIAILLVVLGLFPSAFAGTYTSVFNAYEKMEYPAQVTFITTALKVAMGVPVLMLGWGFVGLFGASVFVNMITALLLLILLRRTIKIFPHWELDLYFCRKIALDAYPLMVNNFLSTLFFRIDVMILQPLKGVGEVGFYSTAYKIVDALNIIPSFFTQAIFPIISRKVGEGREALSSAYYRSLKMLMIISFPIAVGTSILAEKIVLMLFGEAYLPAAMALRILIWFLPFSFYNSLTHYVLIALNRQQRIMYYFALTAAFNITANILLIPTFGYLGASVATILSEIVLLIPFYVILRKDVVALPLLEIVVKPLIAAMLMGGFLLFFFNLNLFVLIALGIIIYGMIALLFKIIRLDEISLIRNALSK